MRLGLVYTMDNDTTFFKNGVRDLSRGAVVPSLFFFALPLFGSSLIQQLYSAVDLIFVGNILGKEASAAVGSGSLLISCLIDFFIGLGVGVNILCAQYFGAKDIQKLRKTIDTAVCMAAVCGVLLTILGWALTPSVLLWYKAPGEIRPLAVTYMRIYILSLPAIILFNIFSGILRAMGDSRSPMISQLIGGFANIFGNTLFIYILRLGVTGAALSTMLSQTVAMILILRQMFRMPQEYRLTLRRLQPDGRILRRILMIGIPTAMQAMIITLSNLVMQTQINQLGVDSIAAYTAFYKVDAFAYLPLQAFGQAMVTFAAQNFGAGQSDRVRKGMRAAWMFNMAIALIFGGGILVFYRICYRMFTNDPTVIEIGGTIIRWAFAYYFLFGITDILSAVLRGFGRTFGSMIIMILNVCVFRIPLVFFLSSYFHSAPGIALAYPITWTTNLICFTIYYLMCRRKMFLKGVW